MIEIDFSAFAKPIQKQLENFGYKLSDEDSEKFQKIVKSFIKID